MATATRKRTTKRRLSPEEREQRIGEAKQKLDQAVENLMTAEGWQQLIQSRKWLTKYSLNNVLMIMMQLPEATDVRPYSAWQEVGRYAAKGSKALKIWAPMIRKSEIKVVSPHTQEEETKTGTSVYGFRLVPVFDVSQTEGEPLPASVPEVDTQLLTGDAPAELWDRVALLVKEEGYTLERGDCGGANGWTQFHTKTVRVREDVEPAQAVKTLIHELAHILCGHDKRDYQRERGACEVEAESVACIVADIAGLDTGAYSVPYVANWAPDVETVKAAATRVLKVADAIVRRLDDTSLTTDQSTAVLVA
ncbi:ImmA/IrrE family metallo-endopeptidase [Nonomuraea typhae]|uniref:ImmA/IrrE family metallo-endopeptidase n=1 Tax=Nonomuraea typhae TaxID=2603600 RepID=A0ABW7YJA0_9ACTN